MPRYGRVPKRKISKDAVYNDVMVHKFINKIMVRGRKASAEKIVYSSLEAISKKLGKPALECFQQVIKNVAPLMEVKSRRVGGSTYQVPIEVSDSRGLSLAMKWLKQGALSRQGRSMAEKLTAELIDAYNGTGGGMRKREDLHKTAESNRAFAHFRW